MKGIKNFLRRVNDSVCSDDGILLGTCNTSLTNKKNYIVLVFGSAIIQYSLPIVFLLVVVPFITGNIAAIWTIEFLRALNPFFVIAYLPMTFIDAVFLGVLIIVSLAITIGYWYFFYREIGSFMLIALGAWLLCVALWYIPMVGPPLAIIISAIPWLPAGAIFHWLAYN